MRFSTIAQSPPAAIPEESKVLRKLGRNCKMSGLLLTPSPIPKEIAMMRIERRLSVSLEMILTPVAAIVPNITSVAPPKIGSGI